MLLGFLYEALKFGVGAELVPAAGGKPGIAGFRPLVEVEAAELELVEGALFPESQPAEKRASRERARAALQQW